MTLDSTSDLKGLYSKAGHVAWRGLEGKETVLIDLEKNRLFAFNQAASMIWEELLIEVSWNRLQEVLESKVGESRDIVAALERFLRELIARGLILGSFPEESEKPIDVLAEWMPQIIWEEDLVKVRQASTCSFLPDTTCDFTPPGPSI